MVGRAVAHVHAGQGEGNASNFRKKLRFGEEDSANISTAMKPPLPHLEGSWGLGAGAASRQDGDRARCPVWAPVRPACPAAPRRPRDPQLLRVVGNKGAFHTKPHTAALESERFAKKHSGRAG